MNRTGSMKMPPLATLWALSLVALAGPGLRASAPLGAQLLVTPTRVILDGRLRSTEVMLINGGTQAATYRVSLVEVEMDEQGNTRTLEGAPGAFSAQPLIRFSPRQVTLAPGACQSVRIQVRKPEQLGTGEYRSHMLFQAVPPPAPKEASQENPEHLAIEIRAIYGLTIPVIVRHGSTQAQCSLSQVSLQGGPGRSRLGLQLHRQGNRSCYGDVVATWQPAGGKALPVGRVNGIAVYANLAQRAVEVGLDLPQGKPLKGGVLKVAYLEHEGTRVLAEGTLSLP